jgi:DNA-binding transcriptional regulator GbsR (MarR family)
MKAMWKNVKQTATIAAGKITADPADEDPEYRVKSEIYQEMTDQIDALLRAFSDYSTLLERQAATISGVHTTFAAAIPAIEPQHAELERMKQSSLELSEALTNIAHTEIPTLCGARLAAFREKLHEVRAVKGSRKDARILMVSDEKKLNEAREKNAKDVVARQERYDAQKDQYETLHSQFMTTMEQLIQERVALVSDVFHTFLALQVRVIELQQLRLVEPTAGMVLNSLKDKLPSLTRMEFGALPTVEVKFE